MQCTRRIRCARSGAGGKDVPVAVPQSSGRQRLNIHDAIDLETGNTRMIEAATVNVIRMIMLLRARLAKILCG
jgi:hypothetical protein